MTNSNKISFESELREVFLQEAEEMLEHTESILMQIEADPTDGVKIDKIFRLVHTIKGSGFVAGFTALGNFAHNFEALLDALRSKKISASPEVIDILLAGNDFLNEIVKMLRVDPAAPVNGKEIETRIDRVLQKQAGPARAQDPKMPTGPSRVGEVSERTRVDSSTKSVTASDTKASSETVQPPSHVAGPLAEPRATVLVCDDEQSILQIIDQALTRAGYKVVAASAVSAALEIFANAHVDVIITDLQMPGLNGKEFVKIVRDHNRFVPIAFVSGRTSREDLKEFLAMGVDRFLEKPFSPADIVMLVEALLREKTLKDAIMKLSKVSFRVFVSVDKLLGLYPEVGDSEAVKKEKQVIDQAMTEMRQATIDLLQSEKATKAN